MSSVNVEVKNPLCAPWTDDQIKHQLAVEIHTYGKYGHVEVCFHSATPSLLYQTLAYILDWFLHYFSYGT